MKTVLVRYKTLPQHADQNAALIAAVFEALDRCRPAGLRYQTLRSRDGLSFTHVATIDDTLPEHPLTTLPEFQAFVAGIGARCSDPPLQIESTVLGRYPA
jgi:hypothetical protein